MDHDLRILILEDLPADAEMAERELRKAGLMFTSRRVETEPDFLDQLTEFKPDLILADYSLPTFDGLTALRLTRARDPGLAFILLSATLGEEQAVESLHLGATDYVLKHRLFRLVPAVERALRERDARLERRRAEETLRESEERYRRLVELLPDGVAVHSEGRVVFANPTCARLIGASSPGELTGKPVIEFVHPDHRELALKRIKQSLDEGVPARLAEEKFIKLDGTPIDVQVSATPLSFGGKQAMLTVFNDITERKRAEEKIRLALEEKETLLREVHHRVKNNLQAMIALMDLQASHIQDAETRRFLQELQGQARTMALVYEQLYQSESLARVAMGPYLKQLTSNVLEAFGGRGELQLDLDASVTLDVAQAMPCGLIVNELFANILKYAFPPDYAGRPVVGISLRQEGEKYRLSVGDNGVGLPPGYDWRTGQTLGLRLVRLWATHQLGGTLDVTVRPGIQFTTVFGV